MWERILYEAKSLYNSYSYTRLFGEFPSIEEIYYIDIRLDFQYLLDNIHYHYMYSYKASMYFHNIKCYTNQTIVAFTWIVYKP